MAKRRQKQVHVYLEPNELEKLVEVTRAGQRGVKNGAARDLALILMMALNGLRIGEVHALNWNDIDGPWLWVWHGKGDKERRVPLHPQVRQALDRYRSERNDKNPAMFLSRRNRRMSVRAIRQMVQTLMSRTAIVKYRDGQPVNVSPHKLRHTAGTLLARANVPTHKIMDILGHESEATAHLYMAQVAGVEDIQLIDYGSVLDIVAGRLRAQS